MVPPRGIKGFYTICNILSTRGNCILTRRSSKTKKGGGLPCVYPPWRDHPWSPMGSQFDSLSVLYLPLRKVFWISIYLMYLLIFDPRFFLFPRGGTIFSGPLWGPNLISFCLISYPTLRQVFWISIYSGYLLIFNPLKFFTHRGGPFLVVPYRLPI